MLQTGVLSKLMIRNGVMEINGGGLVPIMGLLVFLFISRVSKYLEVAVFKFYPAGQYNLQVLMYYYYNVCIILLYLHTCIIVTNN